MDETWLLPRETTNLSVKISVAILAVPCEMLPKERSKTVTPIFWGLKTRLVNYCLGILTILLQRPRKKKRTGPRTPDRQITNKVIRKYRRYERYEGTVYIDIYRIIYNYCTVFSI